MSRVHDYYEYLWSRQRGLDESEILSDLPKSIRTDIALFLNKEVLEKVPFFKDASENFINVLVRLLKPQVCAPGEFIIKYGDIGREMYFINKGVVVVCSEDGKSIFNVLSGINDECMKSNLGRWKFLWRICAIVLTKTNSLSQILHILWFVCLNTRWFPRSITRFPR